MKNNILFLLMIGISFSCNHESKVSPVKEIIKDTGAMHDEKNATVNIDALTASPSNFRLLLENQYVRVLEYTLEPGKKDEWHTHPPKSSYVVSGGKVKVYFENGDFIMADDTTGTASWSNAVGKHQVENVGKTPVKVILTEVKSLSSE